jgi:beta-lactamase class D
MMKTVPLLVMLLISFASCKEDPVLRRILASRNAKGVIVVKKLGSAERIESDSVAARLQVRPASTFKIVNTLIALDGGYVSLKDTFEWDGKDRGMPQWNRNQTLGSAFKSSCVWCYERIEKKVGIGVYDRELKRIGYGNGLAGTVDTSFWLCGDLRISAEQQIGFLERLVTKTLGFKEATYAATKDLMKDQEEPGAVVYAKTGWVDQVGWYVGYVEKKEGCWLFATRLEGVTKESGLLEERRKMTLEALQKLHILQGS